jgi:polysaccharide deacetylase 2 family uncharacterized protein YibQ
MAASERMPARLSWPALALVVFWAVVLGAVSVAVIVLALLGAPPAPVAGGAATPSRAGAVPAGDNPAAATRARESGPGVAIAAPDAALTEPAPDYPGAVLPRIGPGGVAPRTLYAGGSDPKDRRPRLGLVLGGIGLSLAESRAAIDDLPAAVTLAFSPYAADPAPLLAAARARGHEILLSLPLEPQNYPLNDAGPETLLTGAPAAENERRLEWVLSRITGYAGTIGTLDGLHGERFAAQTVNFTLLQRDLAQRGLFYIDPRPGAPQPSEIPGRAIDLVVDAPPSEAAISAALDQLAERALAHGSALGLADLPRPVTVARIAAWAGTLASHGLALVPASALIVMPPATAGKPEMVTHGE